MYLMNGFEVTFIYFDVVLKPTSAATASTTFRPTAAATPPLPGFSAPGGGGDSLSSIMDMWGSPSTGGPANFSMAPNRSSSNAAPLPRSNAPR